MKHVVRNGYLTVYLALCLTLVISLCLTLIEGARRNGGRLEAECVAEVGMQSIMAEYHRELMKQYNLFAIDSSYGTATCGAENVEKHLKFYLERNTDYEDVFLGDFLYRDFLKLYPDEVKLTQVSILTDEKGKVFRRVAVDAIRDETGLGVLEDVQHWMQVIAVNGLEDGDEAQRKQELDREIESYDGTEVEIEENVKEVVSVVNPTALIEEKRRMGILKQIGPDDFFSRKMLMTDSLVEGRIAREEINVGNMSLPEKEEEGVAERFLFQEYLLKYMGHYGGEKRDGALDYQAEYLIGGRETDFDNLKMIADRICIIREAANTMYLMGSEGKRAVTEFAAKVICSLILLPQLAPVMEAAIILGWAYAESVYDVKMLLAGGRIPLLKSDENWHYGLAEALSGAWGQQEEARDGMSYEDYLRVFMMFQDVDELTVRAMNVVEADIRGTPGNSCFRLDACYVSVTADIVLKSRYGYRYDITCTKKY